MRMSASGLAARSVIAPRWGSEDAWTDRNPARWAGLREPRPSARKAGDGFAIWQLQRWLPFPARGRLEARRGRSPSSPGHRPRIETQKQSRGGLKGRARKRYAGNLAAEYVTVIAVQRYLDR